MNTHTFLRMKQRTNQGEKTMKNYWKTMSVIAITTAMTASVKAEKDLLKNQKEDVQKAVSISQEERERGYAMLGHILSTAQKYLTDEENLQIQKLIGEGWQRKNMNQNDHSHQQKKHP